MRLRTWGLALVVLGLAVSGAALGGIAQARQAWKASDAACAGSADELCGAGPTYVASLGLAFIPLVASLGMLAAVFGLVLLLVGTTRPARQTIK